MLQINFGQQITTYSSAATVTKQQQGIYTNFAEQTEQKMQVNGNLLYDNSQVRIATTDMTGPGANPTGDTDGQIWLDMSTVSQGMLLNNADYDLNHNPLQVKIFSMRIGR